VGVSRPIADIVGAYDVRGLVDSQLTPEVAAALGSAWVTTQQLAGHTVVIGHDMRPSSPHLADALAEAARVAGAHVVELGLCSTDMVYYASGAWDAAGVMITASHNPATYNGLKFTKPGAKGLSRGTGLADIASLAEQILVGGSPPEVPGGSREKKSALSDYADYVRSLVDVAGNRPLRVVVDAANGMAGLTVPEVLSSGLGQVEVIPLYFELDGTFPNHEANPLNPDNLVDLQKAVLEYGADAGLAFDGDADRCFVVDEKGQPVSPSAIGQMVAIREVARYRAASPGAQPTVIYNLICSRAVPETIAAIGAVPHRTAVGHSLIKDEMAKTGAIFGAEHSAHYYFSSFWGADNGMLAALHVLAELGASKLSLSALCAEYSPYVASGEINSRVIDVAEALSRVTEQLGPLGEVDTLDGITVSSRAGDPMWWLNVRASNTEPLMRLNGEAETVELMTHYRNLALEIIRGEPTGSQ
jgi:phosphomannomutase